MNLADLVIETIRDNMLADHGLCIECSHTRHDNKCECGCDWDG